MCVVSMVMDHYREKWTPILPMPIVPTPTQPYPWLFSPPLDPRPAEPPISDAEIREFRTLLERAREYDRRNGEPDCEADEKKAALLAIAEKLGLKIDFL
jgi:hypothetical protein